MTGHFEGAFDLRPRPPRHWYSRTEYDFRLQPRNPLTWHYGALRAQPDRHFVTDGGSIPKLVQVIPAFDAMRYPRSYAMHDSAYRHHAWYEAGPATPYRYRPMTRPEADEWLRLMLIAEGATEATAAVVYRFVRACGRFAW